MNDTIGNIVIGLVLVLMSNTIQGQETEGRAYYELIKKTMSKDTLIDDLTEKLIRGRMATGRMTKEDSTRYYNIIKARKLVLHKNTCNETARKALKRALEEKTVIRDPLVAEKVETALKNVPPKETSFNTIQLGNEIELKEEHQNSNIYHEFSSPINVNLEEHQYLVYHLRSTGKYNYKTEIIIFSVKPSGNYKIDERILLSYH